MDEKLMAIGELAKRTGVSIQSIRYYERAKLLSPTAHSRGGHRLFDRNAEAVLRFIRSCREIGFSMAEIAGLLEIAAGDSKPVAERRRIARAQYKEIRRRRERLEWIETALYFIIHRAGRDKLAHCPDLDLLVKHWQ